MPKTSTPNPANRERKGGNPFKAVVDLFHWLTDQVHHAGR